MPKTRHSKHARSRICPHARRRTLCTAIARTTSAVSYPYDANGAMTGDGLRRYEFDAANRLANVTTGAGIDAPTTRYVHNALGQRLFKTEPEFAPVASGSNPADPGVMQALIDFFGGLWGGSPASTSTVAAPTAGDKLGFQYYYDEDGSLLYELGAGGANSTGSSHYVYLPTPQGPMPIATYTGSKHYAVHTDHLNTPRRLTNSSKQVAWQWAFSAFGDEQPTIAKNRFVDPSTTPGAGTTTIADVTFNLRYPGQYFDKESNLHYNWMRSYDPKVRGGYTQPDPIDLAGGWNKYGYGYQNPLSYVDRDGRLAQAIPMLIPAAIVGCALSSGCKDWLRDLIRPKPDPIFLDPGYVPGNWGQDPPKDPPKSEPWPKENKDFCIRTYANCQDHGWTGNCQTCMDICVASGTGDWPFGMCKPRKKGNMCEP